MEKKQCVQCSKTFEIDDHDRGFYDRMRVPQPTFCPDCRLQRRMSWMNLRSLYRRTVTGVGTAGRMDRGGTKKDVISIYSQDKPFTVIEDKKWWSDEVDLTQHGVDYDFSKPFFQQFRELMLRVPLPHLQRNSATMDNSDYCNAASGLKNCYLIAAADYDENCSYGYTVENSKDCMDMAFLYNSELCYEGINLRNCYKTFFSQDCEDSSELWYSQDCVSCSNCIGCINLHNKQYHIFNKPYSKEEYERKIAEMHLATADGVQRARKQADEFFLTQPRRFMHGRNNVDVSGEYIDQCKNVRDAFQATKAEDSRYVHFVRAVTNGTTNSYDYTLFGMGADSMVECAWSGLDSAQLRFSFWNYGALDLQYSFGCHTSEYLFGCIGLRHKKFCILNKQYSEAEYNALVPRIIEQMNAMPYVDARGLLYRYGEFFPSELSPFAYNETLAQEYFPLNQEEVRARGLAWKEQEEKPSMDAVSWKDIPQHIRDVTSEQLAKPILCRAYEENPTAAATHNCSRFFKVIPTEVDFYQRMQLPLPRYCPNTRHALRIQKRNSIHTWHRQCMCTTPTHGHNGRCATEFETSYAPEALEMVYCETCYQKEIY